MTKQREVRLTAEKCADYGAMAYARRVDQRTAEYNPLGGTGTQACANCVFFMSPNGCTVVEDWPAAISPTGLSRYWTAIPAPDEYPPMRVVIVEEESGMKMIRHEGEQWVLYSKDGSKKLGTFDSHDAAMAREEEITRMEGMDTEKGFFDRLIAAVKSAFSPGGAVAAGPEVRSPLASEGAGLPPPDASAFRLYKSLNDEWWWLALVSNKYRDRDNKGNGPEIIEEAAHVEYVGYLDKTGDYPEAWLWHTPGTRWGKAAWADYFDGFLAMAGPVDQGMEDVAAALSGDVLGVSHGFYQWHSDARKGIIGKYRTFEVSALPPEAAANPWTALSVIQKEVGVPISAAKRTFIEGKLGKERVAALEGDVAALAKALTDAGVEFKDLLDAGNETPTLSAKDIADVVTKALEPTTTAVQGLVQDVTAVKATADATAAAQARTEARLKALEASDDDKLASLLTARSAEARGTKGYRPTEDKSTEVGEDDALKEAAPRVPAAQEAWLKGALLPL